MSDRLLEETTALLPGQNGGHFIVRCGSILRLQDAKSISVDRQMLAGYLNGMCEDRAHGLEQPRRHCPYCMTDLMFAGREGKAPWEEKDAVHTTGKTPRTISPD